MCPSLVAPNTPFEVVAVEAVDVDAHAVVEDADEDVAEADVADT